MNIVEEKFDFTSKNKKSLLMAMGVGLLLCILGSVIIAYTEHGPSEEAGYTQVPSDHDSEVAAHEDSAQHGTGEAGEHAEAGGHEEGHTWVNRVFTNLWINTVFFAGLGLVGVLFFAIQYAAQAGWSAGIKRIPLAFGSWIPVAFVSMFVLFFAAGDQLFHWTHADLYGTGAHSDPIIEGKAPYFFWPLEGGSFPVFFILRMVVFYVVWYLIFRRLRALAVQEDLEGGTDKWYRMRKLSAIFIIFFAVTSSMSAWDWVMSIDTHWFSTMFGWYVFASWWVAGLALITFIVVLLKEKGYLQIVTQEHLHDLGKFVFAFSIFWTYIWFSQFLLIYYAHIPEETIYFVERWKNPQYSPYFFMNLIINFFFPFLMLMTRDSKRHTRILKVVAPAVVFGHWLDFYLMITPGTLNDFGGFGFLEIGMIVIFICAFVYVVYAQLNRVNLFAKNHPMLQESLQHHT